MNKQEQINHLKRAIAFYQFTENQRGEINKIMIKEAKLMLDNLERC